MRKLILITIIAMTSIGCPSKDKGSNAGANQVVLNPNNINGNCQNSYYNPQTGQQTSYNPVAGVGINSVGAYCNYGGINNFGNACPPGYYPAYYPNGSISCFAAGWIGSYATNAYVYNYSYSNSYWLNAGFFGGFGTWGASSAFRGCSDHSFCFCAFVNNTGFGVCTY